MRSIPGRDVLLIHVRQYTAIASDQLGGVAIQRAYVRTYGVKRHGRWNVAVEA